MPKLACRACGRQIYSAAAFDSLFLEERRCPRCGAAMDRERRELDRRTFIRRTNPSDDPGPPEGLGERRREDRRRNRRRTGDGPAWSVR